MWSFGLIEFLDAVSLHPVLNILSNPASTPACQWHYKAALGQLDQWLLLAEPRLSLLRKADVPEADAATVGNDQNGGGHSMRSSAPVSGSPNSIQQACSIRRSALAQDAGVP